MERGLPDDGLKQPIREIVHELVAGNYEALEANGRTELTAKDLRAAVASHGVTLVDLPEEAFDSVYTSGEPGSLSLEVQLYSEEEGPSELVLFLEEKDGQLIIDDLGTA